MTSIPELLAPAGSLNAAYRAFQAGADAVYLGLKDFSARQACSNFDFLDLRKIKHFAQENNKKIYVTLNTIIQYKEFSQITPILRHLELFKIDAVIIQDLGLLNFIQKNFPHLPIHASTQMGAGSTHAFELLIGSGVKRAILPRELGLHDLDKIKNTKLELEVFIHGALCYSYSGFCLASGLLLGRSGNRGQCAQLCRNFYQNEDKNSYPFSCNDLFLAEKVRELSNYNIRSFKIEGRLKDENYIFATVKLYRYLIDNPTIDLAQLKDLKHQVQLAYSRLPTEGYLNNPSGENLINSNYSKNVGVPLGRMRKNQNNTFSVENNTSLLQRGDKILLLKDHFQLKGQTQTIKNVMGKEISFFDKCPTNSLAYLLQKKNKGKLPLLPPQDLWKLPLAIKVKLQKDHLHLQTTLFDKKINYDATITKEKKKGHNCFATVFAKLLTETKQSYIKGFLDSYSPQLDHIFIPPSQLKRIKNSFWEKIDIAMETFLTDQIKIETYNYKSTIKRIKRTTLSPNREIPFAHFEDLKEISSFKRLDQKIIIPLNPLINDEQYYRKLELLINNHSSHIFSLGLNSISHIGWLQKNSFKNVSYWCDFYIYLANPYALQWIQKQLPDYHLDFAFDWVEGGSSFLSQIDDIECLPLMISKGCIKKSKNCETCNDLSKKLFANNNRHFELITYDCLNYLFRK